MTTDQARAGLRAAIRLQHEQPSAEHAQAIDNWRVALNSSDRSDQALRRLDWAARTQGQRIIAAR